MAGRGTDIKLSAEVKAAGGLAIVGTERHDSRRVDRQLRGRARSSRRPGKFPVLCFARRQLDALVWFRKSGQSDGQNGIAGRRSNPNIR